jgi:hypothetical protein
MCFEDSYSHITGSLSNTTARFCPPIPNAMILGCLYSLIGVVAALSQPLPPVQWTRNGTTSSFMIENSPKTIYIDSSFAKVSDTGGLTLIPPTALEFAETFRQDISSLTRGNWTLQQVDSFPESGIFLGRYRGEVDQLTYENGVPTEVRKGPVQCAGFVPKCDLRSITKRYPGSSSQMSRIVTLGKTPTYYSPLFEDLR